MDRMRLHGDFGQTLVCTWGEQCLRQGNGVAMAWFSDPDVMSRTCYWWYTGRGCRVIAMESRRFCVGARSNIHWNAYQLMRIRTSLEVTPVASRCQRSSGQQQHFRAYIAASAQGVLSQYPRPWSVALTPVFSRGSLLLRSSFLSRAVVLQSYLSPDHPSLLVLSSLSRWPFNTSSSYQRTA
jgi:hypothetical protein